MNYLLFYCQMNCRAPSIKCLCRNRCLSRPFCFYFSVPVYRRHLCITGNISNSITGRIFGNLTFTRNVFPLFNVFFFAFNTIPSGALRTATLQDAQAPRPGSDDSGSFSPGSNFAVLHRCHVRFTGRPGNGMFCLGNYFCF